MWKSKELEKISEADNTILTGSFRNNVHVCHPLTPASQPTILVSNSIRRSVGCIVCVATLSLQFWEDGITFGNTVDLERSLQRHNRIIRPHADHLKIRLRL
jgi:hypothetical protein